jgi:hypothetical protein
MSSLTIRDDPGDRQGNQAGTPQLGRVRQSESQATTRHPSQSRQVSRRLDEDPVKCPNS